MLLLSSIEFEWMKGTNNKKTFTLLLVLRQHIFRDHAVCINNQNDGVYCQTISMPFVLEKPLLMVDVFFRASMKIVAYY